jgi:hypothetical protein
MIQHISHADYFIQKLFLPINKAHILLRRSGHVKEFPENTLLPV